MAVCVSVLMPVWNEEKFLGAALNSLLNQSFNDFEIILVDDASDDNTPSLVASYANKDPRVRPLRNARRMGLTKSLNRALKESHATFIARLDGDDIARPDRLERQVRHMQRHPYAVLSGTGVTLIDAQGRPTRDFAEGLQPHAFRFTSLAHSPIVHSTAMFRRSVALRLGGYDEDFETAQDYDLWCRMLHHGDGVALEGVGVLHRVHDRSVSARHLGQQLKAIQKIAFSNVQSQPYLACGPDNLTLYRRFLASVHSQGSREQEFERFQDTLLVLARAFSRHHALSPQQQADIVAIVQSWCACHSPV